LAEEILRIFDLFLAWVQASIFSDFKQLSVMPVAKSGGTAPGSPITTFGDNDRKYL
jgi:hypothetical protein